MPDQGYLFNKLCDELETEMEKKTAGKSSGGILHTIKQTSVCMWLATEGYNIGAYPMHYEIRLEKGKVYAEVHYESKAMITYVEKDETHKELQGQFVTYFDNNKNFEVVKLRTSPKCYRWYRLKKSGVDLVDKNCKKRFLKMSTEW